MSDAGKAWGWQLDHRAAPLPEAGAGPVRWTDVTGMTVRAREDGDYRIEVPGIAVGEVRPRARAIAIAPLDPGTSGETLDHLLVDQFLPRGLAHGGDLLVLHGGAVLIGGQAVLFLGNTGMGKSTLTASFARAGHGLLGDDAQAVRLDGGVAQVRAVAPGLRLLPDALAALYPEPPPLVPLAHYSAKQRLGALAMEAGWQRLSAIFVLGAAGEGEGIALRGMDPAASALAVLANSFALDPSDRARAAARLALASRLAEAVPVHALAYPRRFDRLPEVRRAVMNLIGQDGDPA